MILAMYNTLVQRKAIKHYIPRISFMFGPIRIINNKKEGFIMYCLQCVTCRESKMKRATVRSLVREQSSVGRYFILETIQLGSIC
jgi:hypothetical protein